MRRETFGAALLLGAALTASGCLQKDTIHTIYLEPDGTVTWSVLEKDVRSDGKTPADRMREENEFISAATRDVHPVAEAFWRLDPMSVHTEILRGGAPYTVLTLARFARLDSLLAGVAAKIGARSATTMVRRDGTVTLEWTLEEDPLSVQRDDHIDALDLFDARFALAKGRFTAASGFELSGDKRFATFRIPASWDDKTPLHVTLSWEEIER